MTTPDNSSGADRKAQTLPEWLEHMSTMYRGLMENCSNEGEREKFRNYASAYNTVLTHIRNQPDAPQEVPDVTQWREIAPAIYREDSMTMAVVGPASPAPSKETIARLLSEIEECAGAIVRNMREDISPELRDNTWVVTAACHATVIRQNLRAIDRAGEAKGADK